MKILVDTREQRPLEFPCDTLSIRLQHGDYSLYGHRKCVAIERKSLSDLFASFSGKRRAPMFRKLDSISTFKVAALVVEATIEEVIEGAFYSRMQGGLLFKTVLEACTTRGIAPLFCGDADNAANAVLAMCERHIKNTDASYDAALARRQKLLQR